MAHPSRNARSLARLRQAERCSFLYSDLDGDLDDAALCRSSDRSAAADGWHGNVDLGAAQLVALEELPHHRGRVDFLPGPAMAQSVDANHPHLVRTALVTH